MIALILALPMLAQGHILCRRDAEITPIKPSFGYVDDDPCSGTVWLQGISYQCGKSSDYRAKVGQFLDELSENGRAYCQDYCRKRSTRKVKCKGTFTTPSRCGFTIPENETADFGKNKANCDPDCDGTALLYCSIYHGPFLSVDPALIDGGSPNCRCEKE